jgi:aspartate carbamoyltransferase catalytic subunit
MRLGGTFLHVDGGAGGNTSASKKGESLEDTIRCLECYTDVTVLRHPTTGSVQRVALNGGTTKPVINAGDGGEFQYMMNKSNLRGKLYPRVT